MSESVFVDTNVLVYARDASEPEKQKAAAGWMEFLWRSRAGRASMQVLHEFYVTVTQKLQPGMDREAARKDVRNLLAWNPALPDAALLETAWSLQDRYGLSWWDALIVSAAQALECRYLLTEDLQDGQEFDELKVIHPFLHDPHETGLIGR